MRADNRVSRRRRMKLDARIHNSGGSTTFPCVMLDMSSTGARIQLNMPTEIPNEFTLLLSQNGEVRRRCRIVWQSGDVVGVRFIACVTSGPLSLRLRTI